MTGNAGKWKGSTTFSNNDLFRVAKYRTNLCNLGQSLYLTSSSKFFSYSTRKTHCGQDRFQTPPSSSRFPVIEIILNGPFMFVDSDKIPPYVTLIFVLLICRDGLLVAAVCGVGLQTFDLVGRG